MERVPNGMYIEGAARFVDINSEMEGIEELRNALVQ